MKKIPDHLINAFNLPIIEHLTGTSSHGDLSEFFLTIIEPTKAKVFTPNDRPYAYYFAYASTTIFGFCISMRNITLYLPNQVRADVIADGGIPCASFADLGWFDLPVWGEVKPDHALWAKRAYENALIS